MFLAFLVSFIDRDIQEVDQMGLGALDFGLGLLDSFLGSAQFVLGVVELFHGGGL